MLYGLVCAGLGFIGAAAGMAALLGRASSDMAREIDRLKRNLVKARSERDHWKLKHAKLERQMQPRDPITGRMMPKARS